MPTTIAQLYTAAGLVPEDVVRWGTPPRLHLPGVYVVALTQATDDAGQALPRAPVARSAIDQWLQDRPELALDGTRPSADQLSARLADFWLPDEMALYIGRAASLAHRLEQYYTTPLGARRPHAGGYFLKLLANLDELWVHYARCNTPATAEDQMLAFFCDHVSARTRSSLLDPAHPFPFANLEWPKGTRKRHGLKGAKAPRKASTSETMGPADGEEDTASRQDPLLAGLGTNHHVWLPPEQEMRQRGPAPTSMAACPTSSGDSAGAPAERAPVTPAELPSGTHSPYWTQQVTRADLKAGRIRIPALSTTPTRNLLPPGKTTVAIILRGRPVDCSWDPRTGPDRQRSGVLKVGQALRDLVSPGEVLQVTPNPDGRLALD